MRAALKIIGDMGNDLIGISARGANAMNLSGEMRPVTQGLQKKLTIEIRYLTERIDLLRTVTRELEAEGKMMRYDEP